jgi:lysophospholipase L1-like esterase
MSDRADVPTSWRVIWSGLTLLSWSLVFWLAHHTSKNPEVLGRYSWRYLIVIGCFILVAIAVSLGNARRAARFIYAQKAAIIVSGSSFLISLALVEAFVRIADPLGISEYHESTRYHLDKVADPELVFRHRPSLQKTYGGVEVRYNEFGLRDESIGPRTTSELRILALGDSVTFGPGVPQDRIFTALLQKILTAKLKRPVRVINSGVGGYNTVQEYTYLKKEGLAFAPDVVFLTYVMNDIEINEGPFDAQYWVKLNGKSPPQVIQILLWKSWFYRLARHAWQYGMFGVNQQRSAKASVSDRESRGWRSSMEALGSIARICKDRTIPLVVFFFRWDFTPLGDDLLGDVKQSVKPVPVQDMGLWFAGRDPKQYTNSTVDTHPNIEGHRLIAGRMAEFLADRILDQPTTLSNREMH